MTTMNQSVSDDDLTRSVSTLSEDWEPSDNDITSEAKSRVSDAITKIYFEDLPFFANLISMTVRRPTSGIQTHGTNGDEIVYNPRYILDLTLPETMFVFAHNIIHIAHMHFVRGKGISDYRVWNISCDLAANQSLKDNTNLFRQMPGVIQDDRFQDMSAEDIYDELNDSSVSLYDESDNYDDLAYNREPGESFDGHMRSMTENSVELQEVQDRILTGYDVSEDRGHVPGDIKRKIEEWKDTGVNWKVLFKDYMDAALGVEQYTMRPCNQHWLTMNDMILPGVNHERINDVIITLDTSGSIDNEILTAFAGAVEEARDYCQFVTLITADAQIQEVIRPREVGEYIKHGNFDGGGGTDHIPVFNEITSLDIYPDLVVCFTDGKTTIPDTPPDYPVIWVLNEDGTEEPLEWGNVVRINLD